MQAVRASDPANMAPAGNRDGDLPACRTCVGSSMCLTISPQYAPLIVHGDRATTSRFGLGPVQSYQTIAGRAGPLWSLSARNIGPRRSMVLESSEPAAEPSWQTRARRSVRTQHATKQQEGLEAAQDGPFPTTRIRTNSPPTTFSAGNLSPRAVRLGAGDHGQE